METTNFNVNGAQSEINWIGRKVTGAHNGTIAIKSGELVLSNNKLTGGKFTIDTTSIIILDVTDEGTNAQFAGHLASDDFFSSEKHPEAFFTITAVEAIDNSNYNITGDLTIKDITNEVSFVAKVDLNNDKLIASGKIVIDRTKYNMKFRSGNFFQNLGDTLIYNDFDLNVDLAAELAA
ncbi:YceI family protein [Pedobacter soli]|uniref:Polyisoprenoid-binding protein YceI n=1 Tax=Pedobacter soli TaxID=390242 RepID=A0A1G6LQS6_9SPHI|nr:YceI family protein [Pedobacter soli]SDC45095.1 Polyisoprenoid-binding protein YceI [Pedobacter soli]